HVLGADAQSFGELHGDGGARSANIGRAFDQADRTVGVDAGRRARLEADVEPEAGRHAAAAIGAGQLRFVVGRVLRRLSRFDHSNARIHGTVGAARALLRAVH